jgi:BirA family biotin operon repressor/biotin-[acetyl-CoA-carboxylase] ligase
MTRPSVVSRLERFERVPSTQDVVRAWLGEDVPEVCLAVADVQTAGRGRLERGWLAGSGQALMVSAGFRPHALAMGYAWRLAATVALAMLEAIERVLGAQPRHGRLALKWPNDLVVVHDGHVRKLGGVLAEGVAEGDRLASAVVGIGVNVDWPASAFPPDLAATMGSLREVAGRRVDREVLLGAWIEHLAAGCERLRGGAFDTAAWSAAQVTTGADLEVHLGSSLLAGRGVGVDPDSGALRLEATDGGVHDVAWGEVVSCRVGRVPGHL